MHVPRGRGFMGAAGAVAIGVIAAAVAAYLSRSPTNAWDFATFYHAATALRRGLDPYDTGVLSGLAGKPVVFPFLYPPAALALFVPFTWMPIAAATALWLGLKLAMAAALIAVWWRAFPRVAGLPLLVVVAVFGFNAALLWDLETGNITVLEQLLLWLAFACLVHGRRWAFALLVALASMFKLLPIVFLALLFVRSRPGTRRVGPALVGLALFAAIVALPSALGIGWARGFHPGLPAARPFGEINPSALGIFDIVLGPGWWSDGLWSSGRGSRHPLAGVPDVAIWLWAAYAIALLALGWRTLARTWRAGDPMRAIVVACVAHALLSPRMMVYSFVLLVMPALLSIRTLFPGRAARASAMGLVLVQGLACWVQRVAGGPGMPGPYPVAVVWMNLSFFLVLGLWWALARRPGAWGAGTAERPGA